MITEPWRGTEPLEMDIVKHRTPSKAVPRVPWQAEGVDLQKAFERFDCDEEMLLTVLRSFVVHTKPLLVTIAEPDRDTLADYAIIVHGIKSSVRGISAGGLGDSADTLEKAAKAGDLDFVLSNNGLFVENTWRVVRVLGELLDKIAEENPKPKKHNIDSAMLSSLLAGCENYDMDTVDAAMEEIEAYEYEAGNDLVLRLRDNVDKMNFEEIRAELKKIR